MTPRVRVAVLNDVPTIAALGARFLREGPYGRFAPDVNGLLEIAEAMIAREDATILLLETDTGIVGMFAGQVYQHLMFGRTFATEIAWWINPEHRRGRAALVMLKTFEAWAKSKGAEAIEMVAPAGAVDVERLYENLRFSKLETHYRRDL